MHEAWSLAAFAPHPTRKEDVSLANSMRTQACTPLSRGCGR
jgi:hypothetical protein